MQKDTACRTHRLCLCREHAVRSRIVPFLPAWATANSVWSSIDELPPLVWAAPAQHSCSYCYHMLTCHPGPIITCKLAHPAPSALVPTWCLPCPPTPVALAAASLQAMYYSNIGQMTFQLIQQSHCTAPAKLQYKVLADDSDKVLLIKYYNSSCMKHGKGNLISILQSLAQWNYLCCKDDFAVWETPASL